MTVKQELTPKPVIFESAKAQVVSLVTPHDQWGWLLMQKEQPAVYDPKYFGPNSVCFAPDSPGAILVWSYGAIEVHAGDSNWNRHSNEVKSLYDDSIALLKQHGIDIPKPDPHYARVEYLIEKTIRDVGSRVIPSDVPIESVIAVPSREAEDFTTFRRDAVEVGTVARVEDYRGDEMVWVIELRRPSWFIPFELYDLGQEKKVTEVQRNYEKSIVFVDAGPQFADRLPHMASQKLLEELTNVIEWRIST